MLHDEIDPLERARRTAAHHNYLQSLFVPLGDNQEPDIKWLVKGLIPQGYLILLAAEPKTGKTSLATALALAVATGTPFAGIPTEQTGVLWLAQEEGPIERKLALANSPLVDPETPLLTCYQHLPIDEPDSLSALDHWLRQTDSRLVVVDPLHGATSGRSLNDGWAARRSLMGLKNLCALRNTTAIVLHHSKQPSRHSQRKRVAESDQLAATASMQIVHSYRDRLGSTSGNDAECEEGRLITLDCRGRGQFANRTLHLMSSGPLNFQLVSCTELAQVSEPVQTGYVEATILAYLETGSKSTEDIRTNLPLHQGSISNALTRLRAKGMVTIVGYQGSVRLYGLTTYRVKIMHDSRDSRDSRDLDSNHHDGKGNLTTE